MVTNANRAITRKKRVDSFFNFGIIYRVVVIEVIKALTAITLLVIISSVIAMFSIEKSLANNLAIHVDFRCHYNYDLSFVFIYDQYI